MLLITDKALEPFFIKVDKQNYVVYKKCVPKAKDGEISKPYDRQMAACSSLLSAVDYVIGEKIETKKGAVTLMEYVTELKQIKKTFLHILHDDIDQQFSKLENRIKSLEKEFTDYKKLHEVDSTNKIKF